MSIFLRFYVANCVTMSTYWVCCSSNFSARLRLLKGFLATKLTLFVSFLSNLAHFANNCNKWKDSKVGFGKSGRFPPHHQPWVIDKKFRRSPIKIRPDSEVFTDENFAVLNGRTSVLCVHAALSSGTTSPTLAVGPNIPRPFDVCNRIFFRSRWALWGRFSALRIPTISFPLCLS